MINNRRRRRLLTGGSAAAALALTGCAAVAAGRATATSAAGVRIELRAGRDEVALRPGNPTSVWRYTGRLLAGDSASLQVDVGSLLGPTLRPRRGQRVRIELLNELPEATTIHWHGLHVPKDMDGHPRHRYHAHPHGRTGRRCTAAWRACCSFPTTRSLRWTCRAVRTTCRWCFRTAASTATTSWSNRRAATAPRWVTAAAGCTAAWPA